MTEIRDYLSVAQLAATLVFLPLVKYLYALEKRLTKIETLLDLLIERRGDPHP